MPKKGMPYRYSYTSIAERVIGTIPNYISVFIPNPFDSTVMNKYFLLMCKNLHPKTNMVCVKNGSNLVPISSKESLRMYLNDISYPTYRKFTIDAMSMNILMIITGSNDKSYFVINPCYASHNSVNVNEVSKFFSILSQFGGDLVISDEFIFDHVKKKSDERMDGLR